MHVADEVGKYAGVSEGRSEIARKTGKRRQNKIAIRSRLENFQVAAAEGVTLNLNRAFAIRNSGLIATIGLSIPTIGSVAAATAAAA